MINHPYTLSMTRISWRRWVLIAEFGDRRFVYWGTRRRCFDRFDAWMNPYKKAIV